MGILRKILSRMASPLDRYVQRRVNSAINKLGTVNADGLSELYTVSENIKDRLDKVDKGISGINRAIRKIVPRLDVGFEVHLAEHCNLNCRGCLHFSPLAHEEFADLNEFTRDLKRLSMLFSGRAKYIRLLGGEPLLNPEITKFMQVARECFPDTDDADTCRTDGGIIIVTNGILLPKMDKHFWEVCKQYNIGIMPTKYPIPFDYDAAECLARKMGVRYNYYNSAQVLKTLMKLPLDLTRSQDAVHNFLVCSSAVDCATLKHGKLYTCPRAAHAHILRDNLAADMKLSEQDGIDIYKASSAQEIMTFLAKPIPFCRYCNIDGIKYDLPWTQSQKSIDEWT